MISMLIARHDNDDDDDIVTRKLYFYPKTGFYFRTYEDGAGCHLIPYRISPRSEFFLMHIRTGILCGGLIL